MQLDFIGFSLWTGTGIASHPDGHAAHVLLIVATVIQCAVHSINTMIDGKTPRYFFGIDRRAPRASRRRNDFTGGLHSIHRRHIYYRQPLADQVV